MPFGMVSGSVDRWVNKIGWRRLSKGKGRFGVNLGRPIVSSGDFATRLFPNNLERTLKLVSVRQVLERLSYRTALV